MFTQTNEDISMRTIIENLPYGLLFLFCLLVAGYVPADTIRLSTNEVLTPTVIDIDCE